MNREIKFRAWSGKNMLYQEVGHRLILAPDSSWRWIFGDSTDHSDLASSSNGTLMQYTGLKDKDGVEIYEGDIVKVHQFLFDGNEVEKEHQGVIEYKENTMSFNYTYIRGDWYSEYTGYTNGTDENGVPMSDIYGLHEESFEVIGNIYENPELIKE